MKKLNRCLKENIHLVEIISLLVIIISLWVGIETIKIGNNSNQIPFLEYVQKRDLCVGPYLANYKLLLDSLQDDLSNACNNEYYSIYTNEKYRAIREIGYHYEYIGLLVKRKIIPFEVVYDLIVLPPDIWAYSHSFVKKMRKNVTHDFWINFEYLMKRYKEYDNKTNAEAMLTAK